MSINPQDLVVKLFDQLKNPKPEDFDQTIEQMYLAPLLQVIKTSGAHNSSLEQLAEALQPLKKKTIIRLTHEDHAKIFDAFVKCFSTSGYSSYSDTRDPLHSRLMSLATMRENYLRLQQQIRDKLTDPIPLQESVRSLGCNFDLNGNKFILSEMPLDGLARAKEAALYTKDITVDGQRCSVPEIFIADNLTRTDPDSSYQFEASQRAQILDQRSARYFLEATQRFVDTFKDDLSFEDRKLLSLVILILKSQFILVNFTTISQWFLKGLVEERLTELFKAETSSDMFISRAADPGAIQVCLEYNIQFVPKDLNTSEITLQDFHAACLEKGVNVGGNLKGKVDFIVKVHEQKIVFEIISHQGSIHFSIHPSQLICHAFDLSDRQLKALQEEVMRLQRPLLEGLQEQAQSITLKDIEASLVQSVQTPVALTDHLYDYMLLEIPVVFSRDHIEATAMPETTFLIGETRELQVVNPSQADQLIDTISQLAGAISKDPVVREALFIQMLCLCSQRLPVAVCLIKEQVTYILASLNPRFTYTTDITEASVKIDRVKGLIGFKDNQLLVNYDYTFEVRPVFRNAAADLTEKENEALPDCKRALGIDKTLKFSLSGSFRLEVSIAKGGNALILIKELKQSTKF